MTWTFLREEPCHVILILLLGHFNKIPTFEVLDVVLLEVIKLVVILLMVFKPQLTHGRSRSSFFVESLPSGRLFGFLYGDVVLAYGLVFPFERLWIHFIPKVKGYFEMQVIVLFHTVG